MSLELNRRTLTAYSADVARFRRWCLDNAHAGATGGAEVSSYVSSLDRAGRSTATIERAISALAHYCHVEKVANPRSSPQVRRALEDHRRAAALRRLCAHRLSEAVLNEIVGALQSQGNSRVRDEALLTVGFHLGVGRSAVVALNIGDVWEVTGGDFAVTVSDDTRWLSPTVSEPLRRWLATCALSTDAATNDAAPLFRRVFKGGRVADSRLSVRAVGGIIQRAVRAAGLVLNASILAWREQPIATPDGHAPTSRHPPRPLLAPTSSPGAQRPPEPSTGTAPSNLVTLQPGAAVALLREALPYSSPADTELLALATHLDCVPQALELVAQKAHVFALPDLVAKAAAAPLDLAAGHWLEKTPLDNVLDKAVAALGRQVGIVADIMAIPGPFDLGIASQCLGRQAPLAAALGRCVRLGLIRSSVAPDGSLAPTFEPLRLTRAYFKKHLPILDSVHKRVGHQVRPVMEALLEKLWLHRDEACQKELGRWRGVIESLARQASSPLGVLCSFVLDLAEPNAANGEGRVGRLQSAAKSLSGAPQQMAILVLADAQRLAGDFSGASASLDRVSSECFGHLGLAGMCGVTRGGMAIDRGEFRQATLALTSTLDLDGLPDSIASLAHSKLGVIRTITGSPVASVKNHRRAVATAQRARHRQYEGAAWGNWGISILHHAPEQAKAHFEMALEAHRAVGDLRGVAVTAVELGNMALASGDQERAEEHLKEALRLYEETGNTRGRSIAHLNLAELFHVRGGRQALLLAGHHVEEGRALSERVQSPHLVAVSALYAGRLDLEEGAWTNARERFASAVRILGDRGEDIHATLARAGLAVCAALDGDRRGSKRWMDEAWASERSSGRTRRSLALTAMSGCVAAAHSLTASVGGAHERASLMRAEAMAALTLSESSNLPSCVVARRITDRLLRSWDSGGNQSEDRSSTLVVAAHGHWFRWQDRYVDLSRRPVVSRVLAAFVEAWPEPTEPKQVFAKAWPEERAIEQAQRERVRTSVATLRRLGLKDVLVRTPRGYVLAPELRLVLWPPTRGESFEKHTS